MGDWIKRFGLKQTVDSAARRSAKQLSDGINKALDLVLGDLRFPVLKAEKIVWDLGPKREFQVSLSYRGLIRKSWESGLSNDLDAAREAAENLQWVVDELNTLILLSNEGAEAMRRKLEQIGSDETEGFHSNVDLSSYGLPTLIGDEESS